MEAWKVSFANQVAHHFCILRCLQAQDLQAFNCSTWQGLVGPFKARCSRSYGKDEKEQDAWQMGKFALVSHLDHNNGPQNPCTGGLQSSMCVVSEV